ncbi:MAG: efflux RND transporter periplasmic adaptor subunit [Bacteroidota bacterium]|nr:efflux RND transporter periplasmic adaptor subunit [Bacteroidota bacterium]
MKVIINISFLIILFLVIGCEPQAKLKEEKDIYLATSPLIKDTTTTREYVCQIKAIQHIEVRALVNGYLQEIFVDEGKLVRKGQKMFQILPIQYKAELRKAQAEADYSEIEYLNTKLLSDSGVVSPIQMALAKAQFEKAKAELAYAQTRMTFTEIRAPFDGLMDLFHVRLGSLVNEGDLLTTLSDISNLWVYFNVPEAEYLDFKKNQKFGEKNMIVKLKMANNQLYNYKGEVETIEADFNNQTGNIAFRATFPNPEGLLRHGETGNIVISIPLKKAILIPQKATFEVLDQKYVYVIDKDKKLISRRVTIETEMPDLYVIKDGLNDKDKILLEGIRKVRENDKIDFTYEEPEKVIANLKLYAE